MNLDRLQIFLKVVETGSVSAAARAVHLSQPAASRNLQLLEESLGVSLFRRQGRRLALTAEGRALVGRAERVMEEVRLALMVVRRVSARRYHDVRLGSVDSIMTSLLGHVVRPLKARFPELAIKVSSARTASLLERIEGGQLDLAVVAWSGPPPVAKSHHIAPYLLQFYGRKEHFGDLSQVTEERDLTHYPIVELEALPGQPTIIPEDADSFGKVSSLASVKSLVLGGFGVGAMLDFMLSEEERAALVTASVPHDPECALFLVRSPDWEGGAADEIALTIVEALQALVSP